MKRSPLVRGGWLLSLFLCGCGGAPKDVPKLGTVTGVVTLDDQPLADAMVQFIPDHSRQSAGKTDARGRYELYFNQHLKGAAVGNHVVRITTGSAMEPQKVPAKYNVKSELKADVKEGKNEEVNFKLKSK